MVLVLAILTRSIQQVISAGIKIIMVVLIDVNMMMDLMVVRRTKARMNITIIFFT